MESGSHARGTSHDGYGDAAAIVTSCTWSSSRVRTDLPAATTVRRVESRPSRSIPMRSTLNHRVSSRHRWARRDLLRPRVHGDHVDVGRRTGRWLTVDGADVRIWFWRARALIGGIVGMRTSPTLGR
jgi:hypothetical protein